MPLSSAQVDEIIEKNDIVEVISEYVRLERKGSGGYMGLCPFHHEKTPSFSVHEAKQIYKCFGCGKGGNVVSFIANAEGMTYGDALLHLAERAGINVESSLGPKEDKDAKLRSDILSVNKMAARFFYENLKKSQSAQGYFRRRLIPVDVLKAFGLGYATEAWDDLLKYFTAQNVSPELLFQAGLVLKSKKSENQTLKYYDRFRNRVIFPIFDVLGNIIGFGGRVMDDSLPKYLNSPETVAYSKGKNLYGLNIARKSQSRKVIIVEGYMDCIALHKSDIKWAVASLGTALTPNQARLLKKYFDEVYIGYDSDSAGQAATIRGMDILVAAGFRVKVLSLGVVDPNAKDPDEFLRSHTTNEFMEVVDKAKTLVEYKIHVAAGKNDLDKLDGKVEFLKQVTEILGKVESAAERDLYINLVAEKYGVSKEPLVNQVEQVRMGGAPDLSGVGLLSVKKNINKGDKQEKREMSESEKKQDKLEKQLIILLSEDTGLMIKKYDEAVNLISGTRNKTLLEKTKKRMEEGLRSGMEGVTADMEMEDGEVISGLVAAWMSPADPGKAYQQLSEKLKNVLQDMETEEIYREIRENEEKGQDNTQLLRKLNDILKKKKKK